MDLAPIKTAKIKFDGVEGDDCPDVYTCFLYSAEGGGIPSHILKVLVSKQRKFVVFEKLNAIPVYVIRVEDGETLSNMQLVCYDRQDEGLVGTISDTNTIDMLQYNFQTLRLKQPDIQRPEFVVTPVNSGRVLGRISPHVVHAGQASELWVKLEIAADCAVLDSTKSMLLAMTLKMAATRYNTKTFGHNPVVEQGGVSLLCNSNIPTGQLGQPQVPVSTYTHHPHVHQLLEQLNPTTGNKCPTTLRNDPAAPTAFTAYGQAPINKDCDRAAERSGCDRAAKRSDSGSSTCSSDPELQHLAHTMPRI